MFVLPQKTKENQRKTYVFSEGKPKKTKGKPSVWEGKHKKTIGKAVSLSKISRNSGRLSVAISTDFQQTDSFSAGFLMFSLGISFDFDQYLWTYLDIYLDISLDISGHISGHI